MKSDWEQHILLKSLTRQKKALLNEKIFPNLKKDHFTIPLYRKTFKRLNAYYIKRGRILSWKELISDSTLPEKLRLKLKAKEVKRKKLKRYDSSVLLPSNFKEYSTLLVNLNNNSRHMGLVELQNDLTAKLNTQDLTIDTIENILFSTENKIDKIKRLSSGENGQLFHLTKANVKSNLDVFHRKMEDMFFLPTGFKEFDDKNLGIPKDSFFVISGKSGSGKSSLAVQLSINWKKAGLRVCFIPLEMSIEQMLFRIAANLIGVSIVNLVKDYKQYRIKILRAIGKFVSGKDDGACLDFYVPDVDETYIDSLQILLSGNYDVIIDDYITLNAPVDPDDHKNLSMISRYSKVFSTNNSICTVALAQLDEQYERIRYSRAVSENSCVVGNTLINTCEGLISIYDLVTKYYNNIEKVTTNGNKIGNITAYHDIGKRGINKIEFDDGRFIEGTLDHKLLVLTNKFELKWRRFENIKEGDLIAKSSDISFSNNYYKLNFKFNATHFNNKIPEKCPSIIDEDLAYVIGILLSDGHISRGSLFLAKKDKVVVKKAYRILCNKFGRENFSKGTFRTKKGTKEFKCRTARVLIADFFESILGMGGGSRNKYIPNEILQSPKSVVASCIRGMFDGDGSNNKGTISYSSFSPKMLNRLQLLLDKFDIESNIRETNLLIHGDSRNIFLEEISFSIRRKQKEFIINAIKTHKNRIVPSLTTILRNHPKLSIVDDSEHRSSVSTRLVTKLAGRAERECKYTNLNMDVIKEVTNYDNTIGKTLKQIYKGDIKFLIVKSNKYVREDNVYDLTIGKTHNYVANGLYSHNSNCWIWPETKDDVSELGYVTIKQLKARNQNPFNFKLKAELATCSFGDYMEEDLEGYGENDLNDDLPDEDDI